MRLSSKGLIFSFLGTILLFAAGLVFELPRFPVKSVFLVAHAEEDERENEEEDEEEDLKAEESPKENKSETETTRIIQTVVEYQPVTKTILVTDEEYTKDTDGDLLVDAIDPDPFVSQAEYFTDTDNDSVPNILDKYPNEDDFQYLEETLETGPSDPTSASL